MEYTERNLQRFLFGPLAYPGFCMLPAPPLGFPPWRLFKAFELGFDRGGQPYFPNHPFFPFPPSFFFFE